MGRNGPPAAARKANLMNPESSAHALADPTEPVVLGPGVELPADLAARVKPELEPGERIGWAARPVRKPAPIGLSGSVSGSLILFFLASAGVGILYSKGFLGQPNLGLEAEALGFGLITLIGGALAAASWTSKLLSGIRGRAA